MGQAKNRGTQEQRIAAAVKIKEDALEVRRQELAAARLKREEVQARVSHIDRARGAAIVGSSRNRLSAALVMAMAVGLSSGVMVSPRKEDKNDPV